MNYYSSQSELVLLIVCPKPRKHQLYIETAIAIAAEIVHRTLRLNSYVTKKK